MIEVIIKCSDDVRGSRNIYGEPTEEIVRCKDCEWRYVKGNTTNYYWCRENDCPVDDNDFCSWAKMKGGAE